MTDTEKGLEINRKVELTAGEEEIFSFASEVLETGVDTEKIEKLVDMINKSGCEVEFIKSGSNPNRGSFFRNTFFPNGKISIMATKSDSLEQQVINLVHEFSMLQLHIICLPNIDTTQKGHEVKNAVDDFLSGVKKRIEKESELALKMKDSEYQKDVLYSNSHKLTGIEQDVERYRKKAIDFLMYH